MILTPNKTLNCKQFESENMEMFSSKFTSKHNDCRIPSYVKWVYNRAHPAYFREYLATPIRHRSLHQWGRETK